MNKIWIGRNHADVVHDDSTVVMFGPDKLDSISLGNVPARITASWIATAKQVAESKGMTKIVIHRSRYCRYDQRGVLHTMSGRYDVFTKYQLVNGVWVKTITTKNNLY